jgi:hypothetical protein
MSKAMECLMVKDVVQAKFSQRTAYGLLCSITEFIDHERRAMSTDHRLDSAWFGAGAAIKQRGLEQALTCLIM